MKKNGAQIIELDSIVDGTPYMNSHLVLAYEFKDGLNKYLDKLGTNKPISNLQELINATYSDSIEMKYFDLARLEDSQSKTDLEDETYRIALSNMLQSYRDNGIDLIMDKFDLDAIISPTGGPAWKSDLINGDNFQISTSVYAALSGYPNISVPMGFIKNLPVGLSFFGKAWTESLLIEIAYSFEQGTKHRVKPKFFTTD